MPDLNCTEFEARLMQAVEERQTLGESFDEDSEPQSDFWRDLRARANACPHCRALWNEFALLERVLPLWKDPLPPVDLADAVLARWREEQPAASQAPASAPEDRKKKSAGHSLFGLLMVAALVVLACLPIWYSPPSEEGLPPSLPIATTDPPPPQKAFDAPKPGSSVLKETEPVLMDWETLAQDARSAYWVLANDAADSFASLTVLVPPRKPLADPPKPQETKPASGWVEGIGTGLKPIGQDVGRAMGFLLEALPGEPPTI